MPCIVHGCPGQMQPVPNGNGTMWICDVNSSHTADS